MWRSSDVGPRPGRDRWVSPRPQAFAIASRRLVRRADQANSQREVRAARPGNPEPRSGLPKDAAPNGARRQAGRHRDAAQRSRLSLRRIICGLPGFLARKRFASSTFDAPRLCADACTPSVSRCAGDPGAARRRRASVRGGAASAADFRKRKAVQSDRGAGESPALWGCCGV